MRLNSISPTVTLELMQCMHQNIVLYIVSSISSQLFLVFFRYNFYIFFIKKYKHCNKMLIIFILLNLLSI